MSSSRALTCTPPQVVHSPSGVGDWRVETALELRLYGLACLESDRFNCKLEGSQGKQEVLRRTEELVSLLNNEGGILEPRVKAARPTLD